MQSISVIVPTYNGEKKLPNLFAALEKQTVKEFEVIVVSDGSTDNTAEMLKEGKWHLNFRFIQQENKGRSATRNKGALLAQNELLLFFDDDMRPLPDCIEAHIAHHKDYRGSIVTGGLAEEVKTNDSEIFKYKSFLSNKWLTDFKSEDSKLLPYGHVFMTTANFSISKPTFNKVGGFDERLTDAEDFDFAVRAYKLGVPLYFKFSAFAWHDDVLNTSVYIKRQRQYYDAQARLRQIHPEWIEEGFLKKKYMPTMLKASVFKLFCNKGWINAIENNSLKWLPVFLRYQLYDYIITANGVFFPEKVPL